MKLSDVITYSTKVLWERKGRTSLTILGITIGSALIVALLSNSAGLNVSLTNNLLELGANNIIVVPSQGSTLRFTHYDVTKISMLPGVDSVLPFNTVPVIIKTSGLTINGRVFSIDPTKVNVLFPQLRLLEGRSPSTTELNVVAIGYDVANPVHAPGFKLRPGTTITIELFVGSERKSKTFTVSGVYDKFGASLFIDADSSVIVSIPGGQNLLETTLYQGILVYVRDVQMVNRVAEILEDMYGRSVTVINPTSIVNTIQRLMDSFTIFLFTVSGISLVVAGLGIANTMIISVTERTKEIGILRAMGMTRGGILLLVLTEGLLSGAIGGLIGIVVGGGISIATGDLILRSFTGADPSISLLGYSPIISPELLIGTFLFAVVVGTLSGLVPARRASKLDPVVALKTE